MQYVSEKDGLYGQSAQLVEGWAGYAASDNLYTVGVEPDKCAVCLEPANEGMFLGCVREGTLCAPHSCHVADCIMTCSANAFFIPCRYIENVMAATAPRGRMIASCAK